MATVKCRLISVVKLQCVASTWSPRACAKGRDCRAELVLSETTDGSKPPAPPWDAALDALWPWSCSKCDQPIPTEGEHRGYRSLAHCREVFDTASGRPEPGDMYVLRHGVSLTDECTYWDNCPGEHVHVVLPDGCDWDVDSQARNCTLPDDKMHRCWVRTGEPPNVTAGKGGRTCSAGAGSIATGSYHGFLVDGELRSC